MGYKLNGKEYEVPTEISYRQYYKLSLLLSDLDMAKVKSEKGINFQEVLRFLFNDDKLPEFFATLLVPKNEKVWKEENLKDKENFLDIGDTTAVEILKDFLSGRGNLIASITDYFQKFLTEKNESLES